MQRPVLPALLLTAAALAACATNPVTGKRELSLMSEEQEIQIGREQDVQVRKEMGVYSDEALQKYIMDIGVRLSRVSERPELPWHYTVVDSPAINAFALPGGYIYITRGILASLNSEAQLAGVLGHEIGHVTHRHTAESMTQQSLMGLGLGALEVASPTLRRYDGAAQQALGLMFLSYSRAHETEADQLGVEYATRAGYDPREIPATYAMLKRVSQAAGSTIPPFLSTHPDPGDREVRTAELARAAAAGKMGLLIRQRDYLQHLEGLVYGRDPRQGYFEGAHYFHPTLGFEMEIPEGWKTQDSRAAMQAAEPSQKAGFQLSVARTGGTPTPAAFVQALVADGKIQHADGGSERPGGYDAWIGRLAVAGQNGPTILDAGFIRISRGTMLQLIGQSAIPGDDFDHRIMASLRSIRPLYDQARRDPLPSRVHLTDAPRAGAFADVIAGLGPLGISADELAIINNVESGESIQGGKRIKLVRPSRTR